MIRYTDDNPFNDAELRGDRVRAANSHDDQHARHYDPETGRWLNLHSIGYEAGDVNLYRYVGNAPCNVTDPTRDDHGIEGSTIPVCGCCVLPGAAAVRCVLALV